jgi:hypothetical protein
VFDTTDVLDGRRVPVLNDFGFARNGRVCLKGRMQCAETSLWSGSVYIYLPCNGEVLDTDSMRMRGCAYAGKRDLMYLRVRGIAIDMSGMSIDFYTT